MKCKKCCRELPEYAKIIGKQFCSEQCERYYKIKNQEGNKVVKGLKNIFGMK